MQLQDRSGNGGGDGAEECLLQNLLLCLSVCDQKNLLCLHNGKHTHCNCLTRNVVDAFKETGICHNGGLVQIYNVRSLYEFIGRLVKANVTVKTNT